MTELEVRLTKLLSTQSEQIEVLAERIEQQAMQVSQLSDQNTELAEQVAQLSKLFESEIEVNTQDRNQVNEWLRGLNQQIDSLNF